MEKSTAIESPDPERITGIIIAWLLTNSQWVHRRVETAELIDSENVRRHVSVDFTLPVGVPDEPPHIPVKENLPAIPVTFLDRRVLRNLDVRDEEGRALPVLTTAQDVPFSTAALLAYAESVLGRNPCEPVRVDLEAITGEDREAALGAARSIEISQDQSPATYDPVAVGGEDADLEKRDLYERQHLMQDDYFPGLMRSLVQDYVLLVDLKPEPGKRRIVKYSYEHRIAHLDPNPVRWLAVRLGWWPFKLTLKTPAAARTESYHCELLPPPGLEFTRARLEPGPGQPRTADNEDDGGPGRAHVFAAGLDWAATPSAVFSMRTVRVGFLRSAFLTCFLATALLLAGRSRLTEIATEVEASATVLLVVPGLLAAYLSRVGEHALASSMLVGVRLMLLVSGLCALGCGALLVAHIEAEDLKLWWTSLSLLSAVALGVVTLANVLPLRRYRRRSLSDARAS